jgi:hypothetical protein
MIMLGAGKRQGTIIAAGTPDEIKAHPDPEVQQFIRGEADGPVPLKLSCDDYAERLLGTPRPSEADRTARGEGLRAKFFARKPDRRP